MHYLVDVHAYSSDGSINFLDLNKNQKSGKKPILIVRLRMKLALSETIAKSATLLMRAVEELQSTGSFRYDKPFTQKKKRGRKIWNKSSSQKGMETQEL